MSTPASRKSGSSDWTAPPIERLTADQREYVEILNARYCMVACSRCGAKPHEQCIGQYGRRTMSTHVARKDDAAKAGFVLGRRGNIHRVRAWGALLRFAKRLSA